MKKWRYITVRLDNDNTALVGPSEGFENEGWANLDELGALGWELAGIIQDTDSWGYGIFKRELTQDVEDTA